MSRSSLLVATGFLAILGLIVGLVVLYNSLSVPSSEPERERSGVFSNLFPFGNRSTTSVSQGEDEVPPAGPIPRLRKVSDAQVSGARFAVGLSGEPSIRYVERETGHIYEAPLTAFTAIRLTNTTVPRSLEALWLSASSTVLRFVNENDAIENFSGFFSGTTTDQTLRGVFLKNYSRIAPAQGGVLGLSTSPTGSVLEFVSTETQTARIIFASSINSWVPHAAGNRFFVQSAPSGLAQGSLYEVEEGELRSLIKNVPGLSVRIRSDGERILASSGTTQNTVLFVTDANGARIDAPVRRTLAEKCVWVGETEEAICAIPKELPRGIYPDDWLLGRIQTNDELWRIDTVSGTQTALIDPEETVSVAFDILQMHVSPDGGHVLFINKTDQTLWVLRLQE